jgi:hypothetical protein
MLARRMSVVPRSAEFIPLSFLDSSVMLSWRGAVDGSAGVCAFLILALLDDLRIVQGASSETALGQQLVQVDKCTHGNPRRTKLHSGASDRIQHPCRHQRNHTRCRLDVDEATGSPLLAAAQSHAAPIERVPAVVDFNFLPDMGRMIG